MPSCSRSASRPSHPTGPLNPPNRRIRTRMSGGVGGEEPRGSPLSRLGKEKARRFTPDAGRENAESVAPAELHQPGPAKKAITLAIC